MAAGKKSEGTTRRDFLTGSGAALAFGVAGGLAGCVGDVSNAEAKNRASGRIEHDSSLCAGCSVCMLMCSLFHEGETCVALSRNELVREPFEGSYSMNVCRQCLSPSCYEACPEKDSALCIDKVTGVKYVNSENCIGCGECNVACPLITAAIKLNTDKEIAFKCDLCRGRENGPICVEYCAQNALAVTQDKGEG